MLTDQRIFNGAEEAAAGTWPERKPLDDTAEPEPLPVEIIPEQLRGYVADVADRMSVPLGFVAVPMIVALGSLLGTSIGVKPKRHDDWYEHANLWGAIVANPGTMKSPAAAEALRPLHTLASRARKSHDLEMADFSVRAQAAKNDVDSLEAEIRKVNRGDTKRESLAAEIREKQNILADEPKKKLYVVHDCTVEKLSMLLRDNPRGLLQERDELSGWLSAMEKQGREGDRSFYLESWSGKQEYSTQRISRGDVHVERMCLSVIGTIQPGPIRELVAEAERGGGGADGLLQRFQLLSVLSRSLPYRHVDRIPDVAARNRVTEVFRHFDDLDTALIASEQGPTPLVRFNSRAQALFVEYRSELERKIHDANESPTFVAFLSKMRKTVPALALIFHICEMAESGDVHPINEDAIHAACAFGEILESHGRWLYEPRRNRDVRALADLIERGRIEDGESVRSIMNRGLAGLKSRESLGSALSVLAEANWLTIEETEPSTRGGRPSEVIRLHPDLRRTP